MRNTIKNIRSAIIESRGFTLVEMAIVTIIVGLVIAAAAQLMTQRQKWVRDNDTRVAIDVATAAISDFRANFGRYPCPASLTAVAGNALYGIESDSLGGGARCDDTAIAAGTGIDAVRGYAVVNGARNVTYTDRSMDPPVDVTGPVRVRVGTIPFKNLNMEEEDSYDGYGQRIIYAVTEPLAVKKKFTSQAGAIGVLNDQDAQITEPANSAEFFIFSAGENGAGGFTSGGNRIACLATSKESENCDFDVDAIFQITQTSTTANGNATAFDDIATFSISDAPPLWEKNPAELPNTDDPRRNNVMLKTTGNLGIGASASLSPSEDVEIEGTVIARDDPNTPYTEGNIQSDTICDYTSGSTTCFPSNLIAGQIATGGGMECPSGEFMVGIKNGAPVCQAEIRIECPSGKFALGVNADGSLNCGAPPPAGCVNTDVKLCSVTKTLFAAAHNTYRTITLSPPPGNPGGTRNSKYQCKNGSWKHISTWGDPCTCTPSSWGTTTVSCKSWSACGNRYTGTKKVQTQRVCPSGNTKTVTLDASGCSCDTTSRSYGPWSCPPGFNSGYRTYKNTHICSATPHCSGNILDQDTCECVVKTDYRDVQCPGGLTGKIKQERTFNCPNGSTNPGAWGSWANKNGKPDSFYCSCVGKTTIDKGRGCPTPGHVGDYWVEVDFQCPSATTVETVVKDTCAPPPPRTCTWKSDGSEKKMTVKSGNKINTFCNSSCDTTGTCWSGTTGNYMVGPCSCK